MIKINININWSALLYSILIFIGLALFIASWVFIPNVMLYTLICIAPIFVILINYFIIEEHMKSSKKGRK